MKIESKKDCFKRLAKGRLSKAIKSIRLISNLAGSRYVFTKKDVNLIFSTITKETQSAKSIFEKKISKNNISIDF